MPAMKRGMMARAVASPDRREDRVQARQQMNDMEGWSRFRRVVSALTYSVLTERCGFTPAAGDISPNRVVGFVLDQQARMPDFLRLPLRVATLLFDAWAIPFTGRAFHRLPHPQRWRFVCAWKNSRLVFCRDLVRFYESLAVFSWYSEGAWRGPQHPGAAPRLPTPVDRSG